MKFMLISPKNRTVYNFRGELLKEVIHKGYEVIVTGPNSEDAEKITALGAEFVEIPMNKNGTSVIGDLKYCTLLRKLIKEEKPDVILSYTVKPVIYGAIAAHLAGIKNINGMVTGGGYTFTAKTFRAKVLGAIVRMLYRIGFHYTDHIIFQNPDDLREFRELGLVKKQNCFVVNGSGVNMAHFVPAALPERTSFFMLSRLLKSKGVQEYLDAAKIINRKYPETEFYLLGKYETAMQDAMPREIIEQCILDGIVKRFDETDDVRPYYEKCSVFVLPSYREGTPRTVLEAMAMGRAIITTDTNGCRETVHDGVNGYLVPVGDAQAIAEKMREFIENSDLAAQMGQESIRLCKEKFESSKVNSEMLRIMGI